MRAVLYVAMMLGVMGLAFWAYRENYRTQGAINDMAQVQREIAGLREELSDLRAEWAWLNRPERLKQLVDLNFDRLLLVPMNSGQFVDARHVAYPEPKPDPESDDDAMTQENQP